MPAITWADSLLETGSMLGMDVRIVAPRQLWPTQEFIESCRQRAATSGARVTVTDNVDEGVKGVGLPAHGRLGLDGRGP